MAMFWEKLENGAIRCNLCPHRCRLADGQAGLCRVRVHRNGTLVSLNRDRLVAAHVDPVEKKPLYHFFPGAETFSIAGAGCNFHCLNCQNYAISQAGEALLASGELASPGEIVAAAHSRKVGHITFTYTEPTVFYELMLETATTAAQENILCSMVSNGFIRPEPLEKLLPFIAAANIDLKFGTDEQYRRITGGRVDPVLHTIRTLYQAGVVTEVTTLVIPGLNDTTETFMPILEYLLAISTDIPWHLSAFYPTYRMTDRPPTPSHTLTRLRAEALQAGMRYVYTGNVMDPEGGATLCPGCGTRLIERYRLALRENRIVNNRCPDCGTRIYGRFTR